MVSMDSLTKTGLRLEARDIMSHNCDSLSDVASLKGEPDEYFAELKYDGFRLLCVVDHGKVHMFTRSLKPQDGKLPHIEEQLLRIFPPGTLVDGEIVALTTDPDGKIHNNFDRVQSVMNSLPARSRELQVEGLPLTYTIFDITFLDGKDIRSQPLIARRKELTELIDDRKSDDIPQISHSPTWTPTQSKHDSLVARGAEGTVVKRKDSPYVNDASGKGWFKIKAAWDMDVIVMALGDGSVGTKWEGKIGNIIFGQPHPDTGELVERGTCKCGTDENHEMLTNDRTGHIGAVFTIKHNGEYPDTGRVRHPAFIRWRPDKAKESVTWHTR